MSEGAIALRKEGVIARLVFANPNRRNAISIAMARQMPDLLANLSIDRDVRVVVLCGSGEKSFVSGADISEFEKLRGTPEAAAQYNATIASMYDELRGFSKPTVAMIRGFCLGGGLALACACDLRVCADDAQFGIPAARLGIAYRAKFTAWLVELVGVGNAREMMMTARRYSAEEALRIGLVQRVAPAAELERFIARYCADIADNAPLSIAAAKTVINEVANGLVGANSPLCEGLVSECMSSEDYAEGRRAFMEKRRPVFIGK